MTTVKERCVNVNVHRYEEQSDTGSFKSLVMLQRTLLQSILKRNYVISGNIWFFLSAHDCLICFQNKQTKKSPPDTPTNNPEQHNVPATTQP